MANIEKFTLTKYQPTETNNNWAVGCPKNSHAAQAQQNEENLRPSWYFLNACATLLLRNDAQTVSDKLKMNSHFRELRKSGRCPAFSGRNTCHSRKPTEKRSADTASEFTLLAQATLRNELVLRTKQ